MGTRRTEQPDRQAMRCTGKPQSLQKAHCLGCMPNPDDNIQRYLVYFKYWTLNLTPLMVYPRVLFPPSFINKDAKAASLECCSCGASLTSTAPSFSARMMKRKLSARRTSPDACIWPTMGDICRVPLQHVQ